MNLALSEGESLDGKVKVTLTRRDILLLNLCLQFMERDHNRSGTLHYDIQSLVDKLSHEAKDCR